MREPARDSNGDDFLSGTSGLVFGVRATAKALGSDLLLDALAATRATSWRVRRAARSMPPRRVLVLSVERSEVPNLLSAAREELLRSRHQVHLASKEVGGRGKFENLNELLSHNDPERFDWLLVVDDDVALSAGFLDLFIFLAERFELALAQPAHRHHSHAAWQVTKRRPWSVVRETSFVEIGPVFALSRVTFDSLLPFPPLRVGWGLDAHWSALARQHGWRLGVVDATPIRHGIRRTASSYDRTEALREARSFLAGRAYTSALEANRTLVTHRRWT